MSPLADYLKSLVVFKGKVDVFLAKAQPLMKSQKDLQMLSTINTSLKRFDELNTGFPAKHDAIGDLFIAVASLTEMFHMCQMIDHVCGALDIASAQYTSAMSQTYVLETFVSRDELLHAYTALSGVMQKMHDTIVKLATPHISTNKGTIDTYNALFRENPASIELYAFLIQKALDSPDIAQETSEHIVRLIENDKDFVLCDTAAAATTAAAIPKTFGLMPASESMSLDELVKLFDGTRCKTLEDLAALKRIGIVLFKKCIAAPIRYTIERLLQLKVGATQEGITSNMVDVYNTIQRVPATPKDDFSIQRIGAATASKYLLLDTIDDSNYRILTNAVPSKGHLHDRADISDILDEPLSRIHMYYKITNDMALDHMFFDTPVNMQMLQKTSKIHDPKFMRNAIFHELSSIFLENAKGIRDAKSFATFVHDPKISDRFIETLIFQFNEYLNANASVMQKTKFSVAELIVTFLSYLNNLAIDFRKDLHTQYTRLSQKLPAKPSANGYQSAFEEMVLTALQTVISDDSNIYQTVLYKYQKLVA